MKIKKKKNLGGGGRDRVGGVKVDVNEELKFLSSQVKFYSVLIPNKES